MCFSNLFSLGLSAVMTGLCYLLRDSVICVFLSEPASSDYALAFTNILLTTSFLFGVFYVLTNALQAMGAAAQALIISLSRQGIIYIPALYILQALLEAEGLAWAQPAAGLLSTAFVAALYLRTSRRLMAAADRPCEKIDFQPFLSYFWVWQLYWCHSLNDREAAGRRFLCCVSPK